MNASNAQKNTQQKKEESEQFRAGKSMQENIQKAIFNTLKRTMEKLI
jgi:hypothetical protein